jgi:PRTRC genetic system protein A
VGASVGRPAPVGYLVARDGSPPPRRGLLYDYVVAGDGLWLAAENDRLRARVPVAPATVRGLPPLGAAFELVGGPVPAPLWEGVAAVVTAAAGAGREVLVVLRVGPAGYRLELPPQRVGPTSVRYAPPAEAVVEVHSHVGGPARFSATDDADEQGLRVYGVVGRLGTDRPEVALRVGAYGHFLPLPWEAVFAGPRAPFRDVGFDPPPEAVEHAWEDGAWEGDDGLLL